MKRVVFLQSGLYNETYGQIVCGDINHNGLNELIFKSRISNYMCWQIWEYRPMNNYEMVYIDTGWSINGSGPLGIETGNLFPFACGLLDQDSIFDLVGGNQENYNFDSAPRAITTVQEGQSATSFPTSLVWFDRLGSWIGSSPPHYITDLDQDGRKEILFRWYQEQWNRGTRIYENTGNNQYQLVFYQPPESWKDYAFGDFDQDGRMEFAFPEGGRIYIRECIGDNQYPMVASLPVPEVGGNPLSNPYDCWDGRDVDNDGRPEFFIAFCRPQPWIYYLYMGEAISNNNYELTFIDQITTYQDGSRRSECGDIDGDSIEEIVWSVGRWILVYKATGNNQFQRVLTLNGHGGEFPVAIITIYDMNKNGYNEIICGGNGYTSIYEIEAVQLLRPNGGETFHTDSNEVIRWQKFYPPRCDSLSLFYSTNNGTTYNLIASNISASDTSFLWTVPNVNSDSCKVKIIAYGPGWQYDESDALFRITSTGIEEIASPNRDAMTLGVKVYPNPAKTLTAIRYTLPAEGRILLQLYDISGRLVKTLLDEYKKIGVYKINLNTKDLSAGVYFLSLETIEKRIIERLIIIK